MAGWLAGGWGMSGWMDPGKRFVSSGNKDWCQRTEISF